MAFNAAVFKPGALGGMQSTEETIAAWLQVEIRGICFEGRTVLDHSGKVMDITLILGFSIPAVFGHHRFLGYSFSGIGGDLLLATLPNNQKGRM